MAEFGPRQTGKTCLYRNLSNYVRIISGGNITPVALFYNLRTRTPGELAVKDAVIFDEISKVRFSNPDEMMGNIKDYMESGHRERNKESCFRLLASIHGKRSCRNSLGRVHTYRRPHLRPSRSHEGLRLHRQDTRPNPRLGAPENLPKQIPPLKRLRNSVCAETLHTMRKETLTSLVSQHMELSDNFKIRDEKSVKRVVSGLIKLLFPDGSFNTY